MGRKRRRKRKARQKLTQLKDSEMEPMSAGLLCYAMLWTADKAYLPYIKLKISLTLFMRFCTFNTIMAKQKAKFS